MEKFLTNSKKLVKNFQENINKFGEIFGIFLWKFRETFTGIRIKLKEDYRERIKSFLIIFTEILQNFQ